MKYLEISNWGKFQHYKNDNPVWIKLYTNLFQNTEWSILTDAQKGQLVSIWMLASKGQGRFIADPKMVKKLCIMDDLPDLNLFITLGFVKGSIDSIEEVYKDPMLEKKREDNKNTRVKPDGSTRSPKIVSRFEEFWKCWPKKRKKKEAKGVWKTRGLDKIADNLITDVQNRVKRDKQWLDGFIPNCTTYLRGELWEDELTDGKPSAPRHASHKIWEAPEWIGKDHH